MSYCSLQAHWKAIIHKMSTITLMDAFTSAFYYAGHCWHIRTAGTFAIYCSTTCQQHNRPDQRTNQYAILLFRSAWQILNHVFWPLCNAGNANASWHKTAFSFSPQLQRPAFNTLKFPPNWKELWAELGLGYSAGSLWMTLQNLNLAMGTTANKSGQDWIIDLVQGNLHIYQTCLLIMHVITHCILCFQGSWNILKFHSVQSIASVIQYS